MSGGLDSCVSAAVAAEDHDLALLHISYGQLTEARELQAFTAIADHFAVERRLVCQLSHLRQIGGTSLIATGSGHNDLGPTVPTSPLPDCGDLPDTYVPFRNANLLAVAVSWSETLGAAAVFVGAHQAVGTGPNTDLRIRTPLLHLDKAAIVRLGTTLDAPLDMTWSCYRHTERACGNCHSCQLRRSGFADAGVPDLIPYA